jgi:glycerol-3-phosphate O-acyltransferase
MMNLSNHSETELLLISEMEEFQEAIDEIATQMAEKVFFKIHKHFRSEDDEEVWMALYHYFSDTFPRYHITEIITKAAERKMKNPDFSKKDLSKYGYFEE